jgi:AcrR family transcriptional regulator
MTSLTQSGRGGRGARARILTAASELFYFEGINATSVDRIASRASVSKRTLYRHFPSKTVLVEEYRHRLRREARDAEGASTDTSDPTPRARLLALFELSDADNGRDAWLSIS